MAGKSGLPPDGLRYLLDESLHPAVAKAMRLVDYEIRTVEEALGAKGVQDPDIIAWCRQRSAIWVHADERAKYEHRRQLLQSGIRSLLIHRPKQGMSSREQLRILIFVLPKLEAKLQSAPRARHYKVNAVNTEATPRLSKLELN